MRVVMVAAEMAPFAKVGGLADVLGALPRALAGIGCEVTVVLPFHRAIRRDDLGAERWDAIGDLHTLVGPRREAFAAWRVPEKVAGVPLVLLENRHYFDRDAIYDDPKTKKAWPDNGARNAAFAQAAVSLLRRTGAPPDVLHLHDHQTSLVAAYLRKGGDPQFRDTRIVYTIHNLGYQGLEPVESLYAAGFTHDDFWAKGPFEFHGQMNFMKAGIWHADAITTVSPTYAREICDDLHQGFGLDGVLRERRDRLHGILNGIDVKEWDPASDPLLPARYSAADLAGKEACKKALLQQSGLPSAAAGGGRVPLLGMITRLVEQKGLDLLEEALPGMLALGVRLVVLGSGDPRYQDMLARAAKQHPDRVAVHLKFDNALAHRIEAGADMFLMPSRYEPCGLNQMYSLRYGTVPVVRKTGGLADTIRDSDLRATGNGFVFEDKTGAAFLDAVRRAVERYADAAAWKKLMLAGMAEDNSWDASARRYKDLYRTLLAQG